MASGRGVAIPAHTRLDAGLPSEPWDGRCTCSGGIARGNQATAACGTTGGMQANYTHHILCK